MTPSTARLFFALWPDRAMQAALRNLAAPILSAAGEAGREVPAGNLHLTLAFLGSVAEDRVPVLSEIAREVAQGFGVQHAQVEVTLDTLEHWRKPQVLCATSSGPSAAAMTLAEILKQRLVAEGFAPDLKPFSVHATVARKVKRALRTQPLSPLTWTFGEFALVQSQTLPSGSLYTVRERFAFLASD